MLDSIIEELAAAQQQDRRIASARAARLAEALRPDGPHEGIARGHTRRAAFAKALRALAYRLAPSRREPAPTPRKTAGAQP